MKSVTLNVQHTLTTKLSRVRHFIEFQGFPEVRCLREMATISFAFRFHPLYAAFFSFGA